MRLPAAAAAGFVIRYARRVAGRPPRIWHGFHPMHSISDLVAVDRSLGLPTRSVVFSSKVLKYALMTDDLFDLVLDSAGVEWFDYHWTALEDLLRRGDIWVAHFDCLFFRWHDRRNVWAMRLLRVVGIRIIVMPHGSDIVQWPERPDRYGWVQRMSLDYPTWDFDEQTVISRKRIELFSRFADFVISADASLDPFLSRRDVLFKYFPVDTARLTPGASPSRQVPVIVHAPNHRLVKGTQNLIDAVERLNASGIACTLRLVEKVPHVEAEKIYREADIIADQFVIGAFGTFALEGLALGRPVLTYLDEGHLRDPRFNLPIVNTTLDNITSVLAALVSVPELRERLGNAGRQAVERYQSVAAIAEVWDRIYRHVWRGEPLRLEETVHFSPERTPRPLTEDPAREEFWPVPVADLMPKIVDAVTRVREA